MIKSKTTLLLFAIILFAITVKSENPCGIMYPSHDTTNWGIGFIRIPINKIVALKGLTVKSGKECYVGNGEIRSFQEKIQKIDQNDFVYLGGYDYMLIKVYQIKDTKYRICAKTIDGGVWVEYDELASEDFMFTTYLAFLTKTKNFINYYGRGNSPSHINIGINLINSCLNLRSFPSTDSTIITCLKNNESNGRKITHIELLEIRNGWARAIARESVFNGAENSNAEGCSFKVVNEYEGYFKVMVDNGRPNIWYTVSSY